MTKNDNMRAVKLTKKKLVSYAGQEEKTDFHLEILNIVTPDKSKILQLQEDFKLSNAQIHELEMLLEHVRSDLETFNKSYSDTEGRTKKIKAAVDIELALFQLKAALETHQNELNDALPIDVQERIGEAFDLSFARFTVNDDVSYKRLNEGLNRHFLTEHKIDADQIERLTLPRRQSIGMKDGGHMLWRFIENIHRPMAVWTALHNANSGGRPRKYAHEYLLFTLARQAKILIGTSATINKKGRFVDYATRVVEICGLDPQGTDSAIPNVVREANEWLARHQAKPQNKSIKV